MGIPNTKYQLMLLSLVYASKCTLVVFGDSYSDIGNVDKLTNHQWPQPSLYYKGHFSNGPMYSEYLSLSLGCALKNFAFGGSTTNNALVQGVSGASYNIKVPSLTEQQEQFTGKAFVTIIEGGVNDFFYNPDVDVGAVVDNILKIAEIASSKSTKVIIISILDVKLIPYCKEIGAMCDQLSTTIQAANKILKKSGFSFFDMNARIFKMSVIPKYGFDVVSTPCIDLNLVTPVKCRKYHLFYDKFHLSTEAHKIISVGLFRKILNLFDPDGKDW